MYLQNSFNDLIFRFFDSNDSITVKNFFSSTSNEIETATFADGTTWNLTLPLTFTWIGNGTYDTLVGGSFGNNVFMEKTQGGTHAFDGSSTNDTYIYTRGNGAITISDTGGMDTLEFAAGVATSDVYMQQGGNDLVFHFFDSGDSIDIKNYFLSASDRIEKAAFADGTTWDLTQTLTFTWVGNGTGDTLAGSSFGNNVFMEKAQGGTHTFGGTSNNDTYIYTRGNGAITISSESGGTDTLEFGAGVAASDVYFQNSLNDLFVRFFDSTDSIDAKNFFSSTSDRIETAVFADGTTWNLTQPLTFTWIGNGNNDTLVGGSFGNNVFSETAMGGTHSFDGTANNDTYIYTRGNGAITINSETGGTDTLEFAAGVAASDVYLQNSLNDLFVRFYDSTDSIDAKNFFSSISDRIETAVFADGTTWNLTQPLTFTWIGNGNNDTLVGGSFGNNVFSETAMGGTHSFDGTANNDTYIYTRGNGTIWINSETGGTDTLEFAAGVAASDVYLQNSFNDLIVRFYNSTDSIDAKNFFSSTADRIETATFADGTTWDLTQILTFAWVGSASLTTLTGSTLGNNVFDLAAGGDTVTFGNTSGDTNTVNFDKGDGQAHVKLNGSVGTVKMASDISESDVYLGTDSAGDLIINLRDASDNITVASDSPTQTSGPGITAITFADGTTWGRSYIAANAFVYGTNGNDNITPPSNGATVDAGLGNDTISVSGNGSDTFLFAKGDGQDVITNPGTEDREDTLQFTNVLPSEVVVSRSGDAMTVSIPSTGDSVYLRYQFWAEDNNATGQAYGVSYILFADGTESESRSN